MIKPHVINIRVEESDTGSLRFTLPTNYSLTSKQAEIQVRDKNDALVLEFKDAAGNISIAGQEIIVQILPNATTNKVGSHRYSLIVIDGATIRETICKGFFIIEKTVNK